MPDKPFVVTDRRKFTSEGELRPDAERTSREREEEEPVALRPQPVPEPAPAAPPAAKEPVGSDDVPPMPPAPSQEDRDKSSAAYNTLVDHLDTMVRAADPSQGPIPPVNFSNIVHSVYMNAVMQLGLAAPEGQKPRPDILGARQSIDMLGVLGEKTKNNLTEDEDRLLQTILFELRLTFVEVTQALSRAAQQQQTPPPPSPGPSIVR